MQLLAFVYVIYILPNQLVLFHTTTPHLTPFQLNKTIDYVSYPVTITLGSLDDTMLAILHFEQGTPIP